ncbi:MAG: hypothetical protein QOF45_2846, partial [Gaiellaceae bacterium]|nr:hypothetical protein [Gaiellaceae bacterium]
MLTALVIVLAVGVVLLAYGWFEAGRLPAGGARLRRPRASERTRLS